MLLTAILRSARTHTGHRFTKLLRQVSIMLGLSASLAHVALADTPDVLLKPTPPSWQAAQVPRSLSFDMTSTHTGQRYRILLGLPHASPPAAGYPVLWALDGLASVPIMEFVRPRPPSPTDSAAWREKIGKEPAGLIVGIGYASGNAMDVNGRALDYTPALAAGTRTGDLLSARHGGDEAFLKFLTLELRPLLAQYFPMDAQRHTLFGFSYGGLFALQTLSTQPQHFQRYWAASPSVWFGENYLLKQLPARLKNLRMSQPTHLMLTVGRDEQYPASFATEEAKKRLQGRAMVDNAEAVTGLLRAAALKDLQIDAMVVPGHDHHDMLMHGARRVVEFAFAP